MPDTGKTLYSVTNNHCYHAGWVRKYLRARPHRMSVFRMVILAVLGRSALKRQPGKTLGYVRL